MALAASRLALIFQNSGWGSLTYDDCNTALLGISNGCRTIQRNPSCGKIPIFSFQKRRVEEIEEEELEDSE
jgi:hypothetical protein